VVAIIVLWWWGVLGCPCCLFVHPPHCHALSSLSHFHLVCSHPFIIVPSSFLQLAPSFLSHCSPFPSATCKQLLTAVVGGAVIMAVIIFSSSLLFHAVYPTHRVLQQHCHLCCFNPLSSLSLAPSIPPYEQRLIVVVVRCCLISCQSL